LSGAHCQAHKQHSERQSYRSCFHVASSMRNG
jgi:hypothetical protein